MNEPTKKSAMISAGPQWDGPTAVQFQHKVFQTFTECFFRISEQTKEPVMMVKFGKNDVALSLAGIRREFNISEDSPDGRMLELVSQALRFLKGICVGDALPKEITTREASWTPGERHFRIAYQRLTMQMVTWLTGGEHLITDPEELLQLADDPQIKKTVNLAFEEAAERMGLGRARKEDVIHYIEQFATELGYIESLRDTYRNIQEMERKIQALRRLYGRERATAEIVDQLARLIGRATKAFDETFFDIDAQTGEIISALKNLDAQISYIRDRRDDLYCRLMAWEDVIEDWRLVAVHVSEDKPELFRRTYQFLSPRFMQVQEWVLVTKLQMGKEGTAKDIRSLGGVMKW